MPSPTKGKIASRQNIKNGANAEVEFNLDSSGSEELSDESYSPSNQISNDDSDASIALNNEPGPSTIPNSLEERLNKNNSSTQPLAAIRNQIAAPSKFRSTLLRARQLSSKNGRMVFKSKMPTRYSNTSSLASRLYGPSNISTITKPLKYSSKKKLPLNVPIRESVLKNEIINEKIEQYTTKKNAFIDQQPKLEFDEESLIGKTVKMYYASLTAANIKLDFRKMTDDYLLASLVKNMDSAFEEQEKLIEVMDTMSNELSELKQQYNKQEQTLKTMTRQYDAAKMTIEELENQLLHKRSKTDESED